MQSKGAIKLVAILIALACIYQLSFTWATRNQEKKAKVYAVAAVEAERVSPAFALVSELEKPFYLDSLRLAKERFYLDSITAEKVFLGFTYKQIKEKEINLGLDLRGGMNVMLEVKVYDLVNALSGYHKDPLFAQAMNQAQANMANSRTDFITLFAQEWDKVAPGKRLSSIFGTYEMKDRITAESTNAEVIDVIREEAESAISNSFNVLRNRIDRFGVTQPNIQKLGNSGRILVELPGVKDPERVRKLLQGTASLEFWETYENKEIYQYLAEADNSIKNMLADVEAVTPVQEDTTAVAAEVSDSAKVAQELIAGITTDSLSMDEAAVAKQNPLFFLLNPNVSQGQLLPGACIGRAHYRDTAKIGTWLRLPQIQAIFPADLRPMWSVKPIDASNTFFELVAIKANTRDGRAPLDGGVVTDARRAFGNNSAVPEVSMAMNAEGARIWATMTANNIGRQIAIVLDGMVYSYPVVNGEIPGGQSSISGHFTIEEADDLANVLKSGKLPAPAKIVQDTVVGPSLGAESINAGMISFILAFILVLLYMGVFYSTAGWIAD